MATPLQQQKMHHHEHQQQSQPLLPPFHCAPPPTSSSSTGAVAERARAAAHDALARCSYSGAAFFAEQLVALPGGSLVFSWVGERVNRELEREEKRA